MAVQPLVQVAADELAGDVHTSNMNDITLMYYSTKKGEEHYNPQIETINRAGHCSTKLRLCCTVNFKITNVLKNSD